MGRILEADEVRMTYCSKMGVPLGEIFYKLCTHLVDMNIRWATFLELFGKSEDRIKVMRKVAPHFFDVIFHLYWESLLLGLCRFLDKEKVSGRKTLILESLLIQLDTKDRALASSLRRELDELTRVTSFAKDWRNNRLAHLDLNHALNPTDAPLKPATKQLVQKSLDLIAQLLNRLEFAFLGSTTQYTHASFANEAAHVLRQLKLADDLYLEHTQIESVEFCRSC
jgi:hypothetical protein